MAFKVFICREVKEDMVSIVIFNGIKIGEDLR